jgi:hypothetical protein
MKNDFDYTYEYVHIAADPKKGRVLRVDHTTGKTWELNVAIKDSALLVRTAADEVKALLADLSDLAVAVFIADRFTMRRDNKTARLLIKLPIRSAELKESSSLKQELQDLLYWFTEDHWYFQFSDYVKRGRQVELEKRFPLAQEERSTRVALWSGGLDALAGLYLQLVREPEVSYTLIGTGSSQMMAGKQKKVFQKMDEAFRGRLKLIQLPIRLEKKKAPVVSDSRARGFVFLLLGAICALQEKQHTLYIHENGIGAINLPFRECEVGLDHSRSVHPLSLLRMSTFLGEILGQPFSFENPFLLTTKAQMCQRLLQEKPEIAFETMSCDSWHRRRPSQCGYCSSCLLRRQAIAVSGIEERTSYQILVSKERKRQKTDGAHLRAMLAQVDMLREIQQARDAWSVMIKHYPILQEMVEKMQAGSSAEQEILKQQLLHLYQEYVAEWDQVSPLIRQGLLL